MNCIEFDNASYSYADGPLALDRLSLSIPQGEFACILGSNGSGKSTLALHVDAMATPDSGTVRILGKDSSEKDNRLFIRQNVGLVLHNPDDQIVASLVEDDVAFGPANLGITGSELRKRVTDALENVGLEGFERRNISELSGGEKQLVAIAGALAMQPRIMILDEASAMLDPFARKRLLNLCRKLNGLGLTVLFITHSLEEAACAERVIALHQGRIALDGPPDKVLARTAELDAIGLEGPFYLRESAPPRKARDTREACVELEGVSFRYGPNRPPVLDDLSLSVRKGELFGIVGGNGTGKSTLVQLMCGLLRPDGGHVLVNGLDIADKQHLREARTTIGMAFQQPERQLFAATVRDDVAFGPRNMGLDARHVNARVEKALALVGFDPPEVLDRSPFSLSGGEQRRVALAGVLALEPETLVLDEPTAGLDPQMRNAFLRLLRNLNRERDMTVILVSHDVDYLQHLCDRVYTLKGASPQRG